MGIEILVECLAEVFRPRTMTVILNQNLKEHLYEHRKRHTS